MEEEYNSVRECEIIVAVADVNARVGKDNSEITSLGRWEGGGGMLIGRTGWTLARVKPKLIHFSTWYSADGRYNAPLECIILA